MKRTNQFERTNRDITSALLSLMDKKSFEKITIQDILEEARINRSTFYQHFSDKYAILERLQERYINGLIEKADAFAAEGEFDLTRINALIFAYFADKRMEMIKLFSVRSETLDIEGRMRDFMMSYLRKSETKLTPLEAEMLSEMMLRYLVYKIRTGADFSEMSTEMLKLWLDMSVYFFRLEHVPDASARILNTIKELHGIE